MDDLPGNLRQQVIQELKEGHRKEWVNAGIEQKKIARQTHINDFKAIEGDRQMGIWSLPVQLGVKGAAGTACWVMLLPQFVVVALLLAWGLLPYAVAVLLLIYAQTPLMMRFMRDPVGRALSLSAFGVPVLVAGMMVSAFAWRNAPQHLLTSQAQPMPLFQA